MKIPQSGLRIDSPAFPLLQAQLSYWGITDAPGNALGTTLVCADLDNWPTYVGSRIKLLDGSSGGQVKNMQVHAAGGIITVDSAFTNAAGAVQQIVAGTRFCILPPAGAAGVPPAPPPPTIGLWMFGVCEPGMADSVNTLVMTNLAGFNDDIFNNEFWVQVIHNADAPGTAPEREIRRVLNYVGATGTFTTDDFTVVVQANDLVCLFHESIMSVEILGYGTLTLSSATVPEDNLRPEVNGYFNGCLLMPTEGACRFQPRRIVDWAIGTGVPGTGIFTLDPNNPFTAAPGTVDYVIIGDQTEFVPAADGANNRTPSDVLGNKASTPIFAPDNVSDIIRYLKGILATLNSLHEPSRNLVETWQDILGIDPTVWVVVNPAIAWAAPTEVGGFLYAETTLVLNEIARLRSVQQWVEYPNTPNLNLVVKKTILEWEMMLGVPGNLDNAEVFWGFTDDPNDTRASQDIIGFGLIGGALQTISDSGGVESVDTGFGEDLTLHNKFRIEIYENTVDWYLNEVLIATTDTNIPVNPMYLNFYFDTTGVGGCAVDIGIVRCWFEMGERY